MTDNESQREIDALAAHYANLINMGIEVTEQSPEEYQLQVQTEALAKARTMATMPTMKLPAFSSTPAPVDAATAEWLARFKK